ncbi:unnamed protein product [Anisakis simplex]|uniref:DUF4379 domain-containing protein n=1 Tax=Anisakis simplex TaxID=6269 RepID=A0A0M3JI63_ANISI|nr:unnamed protein product [Anisakis simplex]
MCSKSFGTLKNSRFIAEQSKCQLRKRFANESWTLRARLPSLHYSRWSVACSSLRFEHCYGTALSIAGSKYTDETVMLQQASDGWHPIEVQWGFRHSDSERT